VQSSSFKMSARVLVDRKVALVPWLLWRGNAVLRWQQMIFKARLEDVALRNHVRKRMFNYSASRGDPAKFPEGKSGIKCVEKSGDLVTEP
jgi:hypothetical protein